MGKLAKAAVDYRPASPLAWRGALARIMRRIRWDRDEATRQREAREHQERVERARQARVRARREREGKP